MVTENLTATNPESQSQNGFHPSTRTPLRLKSPQTRQRYSHLEFRRIEQDEGRVSFYQHRDTRTDSEWQHGLVPGINGKALEPLHEITPGARIEADDDDRLGAALSVGAPRMRDWLYKPYLRRGKLHTLEGRKGVGKSTLTLWLAKHVMENQETGKVVICTPPAEGEADEDIHPRALAAGYTPDQLDRLIVYPDPITFADTDRLRRIIEYHSALVLVFDTMQRYAAGNKTNWYNPFEVQRELNPLEALVQETGCAIVLVRHHKKGDVKESSEAGIGSQAISGAVRTIITARRHPHNAGEFVLSVTGNYNEGMSHAYELAAVDIDTDDGPTEATYVNVLRQEKDIDADDLSAALEDEGEARKEASDWLMATLADGPIETVELMNLARRDNQSWRTVRRAADTLPIEKGKQDCKDGTPYRSRPYVWRLKLQ